MSKINQNADEIISKIKNDNKAVITIVNFDDVKKVYEKIHDMGYKVFWLSSDSFRLSNEDGEWMLNYLEVEDIIDMLIDGEIEISIS